MKTLLLLLLHCTMAEGQVLTSQDRADIKQIARDCAEEFRAWSVARLAAAVDSSENAQRWREADKRDYIDGDSVWIALPVNCVINKPNQQCTPGYHPHHWKKVPVSTPPPSMQRTRTVVVPPEPCLKLSDLTRLWREYQDSCYADSFRIRQQNWREIDGDYYQDREHPYITVWTRNDPTLPGFMDFIQRKGKR